MWTKFILLVVATSSVFADELKTIGTNTQGSSWKVGARFDLQGHAFNNSDFRKDLHDNENFVQDRLYLNLEFMPSDFVDFFGEFAHFSYFGERRTNVDSNLNAKYVEQSGTDTDKSRKLSVHQAYGVLKPTEAARLALGRQEVKFGRGFFLSNDDGDWFSLRRSFDSALLKYDTMNFDISAFYSLIDERTVISSYRYGSSNPSSKISGKNSNSLNDSYLTGIYVESAAYLKEFDLYYFFDYSGNPREYNGTTAGTVASPARYERWKTHTIGLALSHEFSIFSGHFDGAYQHGRTRANKPEGVVKFAGPSQGSVSAYAFEIGGLVSLKNFFDSTFEANYGYGSGNKGVTKKSIPIDADDKNEAYRDAYGNGSYNGLANIFASRSNLIYWNAKTKSTFQNFDFGFSFIDYRKTTLHDDPPITRADFANSNESTSDFPTTIHRHSSHLGREYDGWVSKEIFKNTNVMLGLYIFDPGRFFTNQANMYGSQMKVTFWF